MQMKSFIIMLGLVMAIALVAGCTTSEDDGNGDTGNGGGGAGLTGTVNYTGTWSGTWTGTDGVDGSWNFTVNFDDGGTVSGSFSGDASGDVTGGVTDGFLAAEGTAGGGVINWGGTISADGSSILGDWSCSAEGYSIGSGTWSGTSTG